MGVAPVGGRPAPALPAGRVAAAGGAGAPRPGGDGRPARAGRCRRGPPAGRRRRGRAPAAERGPGPGRPGRGRGRSDPGRDALGRPGPVARRPPAPRRADRRRRARGTGPRPRAGSTWSSGPGPRPGRRCRSWAPSWSSTSTTRRCRRSGRRPGTPATWRWSGPGGPARPACWCRPCRAWPRCDSGRRPRLDARRRNEERAGWPILEIVDRTQRRAVAPVAAVEPR